MSAKTDKTSANNREMQSHKLTTTTTTYSATMVDKASHIAAYCRIDDRLRVNLKEVRAANAQLLVLPLESVRHNGPLLHAHVLNDHLIGGNALHRKEAPFVDLTLAKLELLLAELPNGKTERKNNEKSRNQEHLTDVGPLTFSWLNLSSSQAPKSCRVLAM